MKKLTSVSIISAPEGKRISYTFSDIGEDGALLQSNVRRSFIAVETELLDIIETFENKVSEKMASR